MTQQLHWMGGSRGASPAWKSDLWVLFSKEIQLGNGGTSEGTMVVQVKAS